MGTDSRSLHRSLAAFGSRAWDFSREEPLHEIEVTPFEVSRYPVTVRQYQAFVEDERGFAADRWWTTEGLAWRNEAGPAPPGDATSANRPQTYVAWFEAHAFCRWLSERTGRTIRLPTEAEWEWAARGADGRIFPWGDNVRDDQSNTRAGGVGMVVPVGCYEHARTPWDHLDPGPIEMTGNVWEWCSSIVEKADGAQFGYPYSEHDGRENEEDIQHSLRATRGGHYDADLLVARCAYRGRDVGSVRLARQGFRPVRDVDDPPAEARL